jgi:hypothetical protein
MSCITATAKATGPAATERQGARTVPVWTGGHALANASQSVLAYRIQCGWIFPVGAQ